MKCPECEKEVKNSKLNTHCRKVHGIHYGMSKETYEVIVERYRYGDSDTCLYQCPKCEVIKHSVKDLANHYALIHAEDMESQFKKSRNKKKTVIGKPSSSSMFTSKNKSGWSVQGGAPGLGKRG